ncbi:MAG TPA: apolipoprotein N-acyltransferase, partial [Pseudomonadales bacterium]|nr:apolipoprotein N-acyltransferase [Pseudomonadales bacterium]
GNIPQQLKWDPAFQQQTLEIYKSLTLKEWDKTENWHADVVIWPEAAIPMFYHHAFDFIADMDNLAENNNSAIISGVPHISSLQPDIAEANGERAEPAESKDKNAVYEYEIHNSIFAIGTGHGMYHKQRLVPFGEYVPLEKQIRGLIPFFDLPMSSFTPGKPNQKNLVVNKYEFAPFICYEIMYPELVQHNAKTADFLLTVSNDAWFGDSIGPKQHFEMARFRALELGKYLLRDTNTGITAIVDQNGHIVSESKSFERNTLRGTIYGVKGSTPFAEFGSAPILILCGVISTLIALLASRIKPR